MARRVPPPADLLILLLSALLLFVGLGSNSAQNEDEARYALAAQEMLASGDWIEPTVQGEPWWNKAPLRVWTNAVLGSVFGFDLWTIRIPSALAGLAVVALMLWLGRLWGDARTGRWAAVLLVTSTHFLYVHGARTGEMESLLLLLWLATMAFATKAHDDERWALAAAVTLGLVGMAKHAAYVVPVGGVLLVFWWRSGLLARLRARTWILGALIVLAIVVPWHAILAHRHPDFLAVYFGEQVAGRVEEHVVRSEPGLFALRVVKDALFPWILWIPFLLIVRREIVDRVRGIDLTLGVWVAGMVVATAASRLDLAWYVLPAVPAVALWAARRFSSARVPVWTGVVASQLLLLSPSNVLEFDLIHTRSMWGGIGVQVLGTLRGFHGWWVQTAFAVLALVVLLAPRNVPARRRVHWALVTWAAFAFLHAALPLRDAFAPGPLEELAAEIRRSGHGAVIVHDRELPPSDLIAYTLQQQGVDYVVRANDAPDVDAFSGVRWIVGPFEQLRVLREPDASMVRAEWAAIPPDLAPPHTVPR